MRFRMNGARATGLCLGALALALIASCGGGTQVVRFVPSRLIVLGDESSLLDDAGSAGNAKKYTVNAPVSATDPTLDCRISPIWVQMLASAYGFVFAQCNPTAASVTALMLAGPPGTKVADVATRAGQLGALSGTDLLTVLAGANDILAQYALYNTTVEGVPQTEDVLVTNLEAQGAVLAAVVNNIANAGGKVLIATVPDMGLTPFALAENALPANAGTDRAALLSRLTLRFNSRLRANIINDGRRIGLILGDELIQTMVKFPATYGVVNGVAAACLSSAVAPTCTTATLQPAVGTVAAADSFGWLWADAVHMSPGGHSRLGSLAVTRATGNPF